MSGLASFFRSFILPKEGEEEEDYDYQESISNVVSKEDYPREDDNKTPVNPRAQSSADWRAKKNETLRVYMQKRMVLTDNDDEQDDDDEEEQSEEYIVPDNDEVNVPFWNEQGQDSQPADNSTVTSPLPRRKKVPHVDETLHIVKSLSALDLYTREFHLSLGFVDKVWNLRDVPRRKWKMSSKFEDDGPLATLFKHVVCLEVTQLLENQQVANMAQAAFQAKSPRRLKIFFYNKYASKVSSLLDRQHSSHALISLTNVPAKCILPVEEENLSWYDKEDLAPYAICIGDKSSMKLEVDGVLGKVSFDAPNLQVTIARVRQDEVVEVDLTPDSVRKDLEAKETDTLEAAYQEWEKTRKEKEAEEAEEAQQEADAGTSGNSTRSAEGNGDGRPSKKARTQEKYHTLSEMRGLYEARNRGVNVKGPKVNVFAAVLGFSSPELTKGYDWKVVVTLVDESTPLPTMGEGNEDETLATTTIVIFCKQREELPELLKAGDVLRMHRVEIQEWKEDIQLLGRRAIGSSYVVVRPENISSTSPQDNWDIVPTARGGTTFDQSDRERAAALWQWAQNRLANYPTMHKASETLTVSDLGRQEQTAAENKTGDLTVMVTAILATPKALKTTQIPLGYLRVWDGTGPPESDPLPLASAGAAEAIKKGDPPSEALQAIANIIEYIKSSDDGDDVSSLEPPRCLCGRVTNVAVWEEPYWNLVIETLQVGTFIRLRNVHENRLWNGLKCVMVSAKSYLTPLPNDTYEVKELLKNHQTRLLRKDPYNPQSGVLPLEGEAVAEPESTQGAMDVVDETDVGEEGFASIEHCISEAAPSAFDVKFQITGTIPSAEEGRQGFRRLCKGNKFQFAVSVNDETGSIHALVPSEIGEDLFQIDAEDATEISTSDAVAIMKDVTREDKFWKGKIRSFEMDGNRFFILDSVAPVQNS